MNKSSSAKQTLKMHSLGVLFGRYAERVSGVLHAVRGIAGHRGGEDGRGVSRADLRGHQTHHPEAHTEHHTPLRRHEEGNCT